MIIAFSMQRYAQLQFSDLPNLECVWVPRFAHQSPQSEAPPWILPHCFMTRFIVQTSQSKDRNQQQRRLTYTDEMLTNDTSLTPKGIYYSALSHFASNGTLRWEVGEGALPWQLRVLEAKPSPSTTMTWIRGSWRLAQATPPSKLSKRRAIDPGGCPQWCWRKPFQPIPKISKKQRTSIFLKLD